MTKFTFDFINAAEKMADKGDYVAALHYFFLQRNLEDDCYVNVAIADTYMAMDLVGEASRYYTYAYSKDNEDKDALEGLICCYKEYDDEAALYYFHRLSLIDDAELDFDPSDFDFPIPDEEPRFVLHDKHDKEKVLNSAYSLMQSGKNDEARELLLSIEKGDRQYCEARLALASIELDKKCAEEAICFAAQAYEVDKKFLGVHLIMIMACELLGDKEGIDAWVKRLDELDPKDEENVTKAAMCFVSYKYYDLAKKYFLRKLDFAPYDKITLLCLSSIEAAAGNTESAFKYVSKVCTIYPDDIEVKELTSRILSGKETAMPKAMLDFKNKWLKQLKSLFSDENSDFTLPENMKMIKWLLQTDDDLYLQAAVCCCIAGMPEFNAIVDDFLINPNTNDLVKKHILLRRMCMDGVKKVDLVARNIFRSLRIKHPDVPTNLKNAYYMVFINFAVEEYYFETKFYRNFRKLQKAYESSDYEKKEELSMSALAVILHRSISGGELESYLELYDCDKSDYEFTAKSLGLYEEE